MAITNYSELKTAVADWAKRTDLTANIPDFIKFAEARINRDLTMRSAEVETNLTATIGSRYVNLPSDFSLPVALYDASYSPRRQIAQCMAADLPVTTVSKRPDYWAVDGSRIAFDGPADVAYSLPFRYVKDWALSDTNTTNDVLTNHPDIYLFGALVEVAYFTQSPDNLQVWQQRYLDAVDRASHAESQSYQSVTLRTDELMGSANYNIYTG